MDYADFRSALRGERLPSALVDLDALDRNVARIASALEGTEKTLRVASKSVRHVGLLRRILAGGGARFRGLLCYTLEEACFLADQGFDELLVAYPSVQPAALAEVAARVRRGVTLRVMADSERHLAAYAAAGREAGAVLEVLLDIDVSYRGAGGRVHLGVQRSPLRSVESVRALARAARALEGIRVAGLMGYEAQVAGLPDESPHRRALNPVRRAIKRLSVPRVAALRAQAVRALEDEDVAVTIVNGGGTGSLRTTLAEPAVTEVTAGSGFLCSHLFDHYRESTLEPAAFFALEVSRVPEPGLVTCLGGGYVASGEPGADRLPSPYAPPGLRSLAMEGAGEVQTPLRVPANAPPLREGDPVIFRHAKAGELAEHFDHYLLLRDGAVEAREPTYRGLGRCFL
jgi:D-serine deaminase-like pyridoxal phosphate-dependent protein